MAISREKKEEVTSALAEKLGRVKLAVLTDYRGLSVEEINELRNSLKDAGLDYEVAKNTLLRIAAKNAGVDAPEGTFAGPMSVAYGYEDEAHTAKLVNDFAKKHDNLEIIGGILDGKAIDASTVKTLASLPSREELYAKVVGSLAAPTTNLVGVLSANMRNIVAVLTQIRDQKA